jgi:hypothetical protein
VPSDNLQLFANIIDSSIRNVLRLCRSDPQTKQHYFELIITGLQLAAATASSSDASLPQDEQHEWFAAIPIVAIYYLHDRNG